MSSPNSPVPAHWQPIALLLVAMLSIQAGASMAKSLFPAVGATGATALRVALATLILVVVYRRGRTRITRAQWALLLFSGAWVGLVSLVLE